LHENVRSYNTLRCGKNELHSTSDVTFYGVVSCIEDWTDNKVDIISIEATAAEAAKDVCGATSVMYSRTGGIIQESRTAFPNLTLYFIMVIYNSSAGQGNC
jgi:hypothetical protein